LLAGHWLAHERAPVVLAVPLVRGGRVLVDVPQRRRVRGRQLLQRGQLRTQAGGRRCVHGSRFVCVGLLCRRRVLQRVVRSTVRGVQPYGERRHLPSRERRAARHATSVFGRRRRHHVRHRLRWNDPRGLRVSARRSHDMQQRRVRVGHRDTREHLRRRRAVQRRPQGVRRVRVRHDGVQDHVYELHGLRDGLRVQVIGVRPRARPRPALLDVVSVQRWTVLHRRRVLRRGELRRRQELQHERAQGNVREGRRTDVRDQRGVRLRGVHRRRVLRRALPRAMSGVRCRRQRRQVHRGEGRAARNATSVQLEHDARLRAHVLRRHRWESLRGARRDRDALPRAELRRRRRDGASVVRRSRWLSGGNTRSMQSLCM